VYVVSEIAFIKAELYRIRRVVVQAPRLVATVCARVCELVEWEGKSRAKDCDLFTRELSTLWNKNAESVRTLANYKKTCQGQEDTIKALTAKIKKLEEEAVALQQLSVVEEKEIPQYNTPSDLAPAQDVPPAQDGTQPSIISDMNEVSFFFRYIIHCLFIIFRMDLRS
jgi:hypothetical protein